MRKHSTRRHPWLTRVDKIVEIREFLKILPEDHPSRPEMEQILKQLEEQE